MCDVIKIFIKTEMKEEVGKETSKKRMDLDVLL